MSQTNKIAGAIFIGLTLIAVAIFFTSDRPVVAGVQSDKTADAITADATPRRSADDAYIYGDPEAPTTIVEFSDFECPFCARLHPTLKQLVDESAGKLNWEYRHLPLPIHHNAELAAQIGECVGYTRGNESFWQYADEVTANVSNLSPLYLKSVAYDVGVSKSDLDNCLNAGAAKNQVAVDLATARAFGGNGTPFNIIVYSDGSIKPVAGALPYENWQALLRNN